MVQPANVFATALIVADALREESSLSVILIVATPGVIPVIVPSPLGLKTLTSEDVIYVLVPEI